MKTFTVYKHTNKTNGKVYIGITGQRVQDRWCRGSTYKSLYFGRAIKKYGWDGFEHEILADNLSKEEACAMEIMLIEQYSSRNPQKGYNVAAGGGGGGMIGKHHTPEAIEKIRKASATRIFTEEHKRHISEAKQGAKHHNAKRVYQYSKDGEFIKSWDYMSLASKELNINKANIGEVCNGHRPSAGGFVWSYEMR